MCSIVLEVPNSVLGAGKVALWARTVSNASGSWVQADRGALAAQSVFLTNDQRDAYMVTDPVDDASFIPVFAHNADAEKVNAEFNDGVLRAIAGIEAPRRV